MDKWIDSQIDADRVRQTDAWRVAGWPAGWLAGWGGWAGGWGGGRWWVGVGAGG